MKEKYGDQDYEDDKNFYPERPVDIEPKIGGFSLNDIPFGVKLLYVGGIALLLIGAILIGNLIIFKLI